MNSETVNDLSILWGEWVEEVTARGESNAMLVDCHVFKDVKFCTYDENHP